MTCFSVALLALKNGHGVSRAAWEDKKKVLRLQMPTKKSKMNLPYFYIEVAEDAPVQPGIRCPYVLGNCHLLAEDWIIHWKDGEL